MKTISIKDIEDGNIIDSYYCHKSGEILHSPGDVITLSHLELMARCDIDSVMIVNLDEDMAEIIKDIRKKDVVVKNIDPYDDVPITLYDKDNNIIIESGSMPGKEKIDELLNDKIELLYFERDDQELQRFQHDKYMSLLKSEMFESVGSIRELTHPKIKAEKEAALKKLSDENKKNKELFDLETLHVDDKLIFDDPKIQISANNLKINILESENLKFDPKKPGIQSLIKKKLQERPQGCVRNFTKRYRTWVGQLHDCFLALKANQNVQYIQIEKLAKEILASYVEDSNLALAHVNMRFAHSSEKYVASHCVNVCMLTIGMAVIQGYNAAQILELAIGALLHDIGHMLTFRPLFGNVEMTSSEQHKYDQHSIVGVSMLKNIDKIPKSTAYIIYQHHERLNGTGRILHCPAVQIHDYAKLIAVADEFDSISSTNSPFGAMSSLLAMAKKQDVDMGWTKIIIVLLSFFPIGSLVRIKKNRVGRVLSSNGQDFKNPVIKIIYTMENDQLFGCDEKETINLSSNKELTIKSEVVHAVMGAKIADAF